MPPKINKSNKTAAAELKKKNAEEAESIVLSLKRNAIIDVLDVNSMKNTETPPKRAKKSDLHATESKKTKSKETNGALLDSQLRPSRKEVTSSKSSKKVKRTGSNFTLKSKETDVSGRAVKTQLSRKVVRNVSASTQKSSEMASSQAAKEDAEYTVGKSAQKTEELGVSNTQSSEQVKRTSTTSTKKYPRVSGRANTMSFCYEIDCNQVSDTINVTDLASITLSHHTFAFTLVLSNPFYFISKNTSLTT